MDLTLTVGQTLGDLAQTQTQGYACSNSYEMRQDLAMKRKKNTADVLRRCFRG